MRSVASITLLAEAALIAAFIWTKPLFSSCGGIPLRAVLPLLAVLAAAMGLQTATLTRIGPLTIHTTFVTGMLNKFAQAVSEWLFWVHDELQKKTLRGSIWQASRQHSAFRNAKFVFAIWISYTAGAVAGTWMNSHWSLRTMFLPAGILCFSALVDQIRPLSVEEENEQA